MKALKMVLIFSLWSLLSYGQEISGSWNGILKFSGGQLRVKFNVTRASDGYSATMDSPDQGVVGIVVTKTTFQDSVLKFEVASAGIKFEGKLYPGDTIPGTFKQGGQELPLTLTKANFVKPARPQEPVKPYPYYTEDVHVVNKKGNFVLAGTLTMPNKTGVFPAVILITGSGPQNRDEEILEHKPFLVIADYLTRNGIAVLRCDDRGTYESKGDFKSATTLDFSTDVEAALDFLLNRKEIDKSKIGLIGHSEGGLIAPMVAVRRKEVAFIVLLAGPGISGKRILLSQEVLIERASGESEDVIRDISSISNSTYELIAGSQNLDTLKKGLAAYFSDRLKADTTFARTAGSEPGQFIALQVKQLATPWMKYFIQYDPAPTLERVKCPVLALDGSKDLQVPPEIDLAAIKTALEKGGNKDVTTVELPNLNHLFQECKTGSPSEYANIEQTFSPLALNEMTNWIISKVQSGLRVEPAGRQLKDFYFSLDVEHLWIAGNHVNWETGVADKPEATAGNHTHCSAFVAAACKRLNMYILRPPDHGQLLLANAQYDWLASPTALEAGWKLVEGTSPALYETVQRLANKGFVVVAICKNPDEKVPGHAALVLPEDMSLEKLEDSGPAVIMAGTHNHRMITLAAGFKSHLPGWPEHVVRFYCNERKPF